VTYVKDDYGFLIVNFQHRLPLMAKPFIFPFQVTQVFFFDDLRKPGWKVILKKEARSRREIVDIENVFIITTIEVSGLTTPTRLPTPPNTTSLIGAIEFSKKNNLLTTARF